MEFRRAIQEDMEAFLDIRMAFAATMRPLSDAESFRIRTKAYFEEHIDRDDLIIFIAVDEGRIVASCMACIFETAPLPSCPSGRSAELLNVFTEDAYRRRGIAARLARMMLSQLKSEGVEKVVLEHTEMGLPLYEKLGFTALEHRMQLKL